MKLQHKEIIVSSFSNNIDNLTAKQIRSLSEATAIVCETKSIVCETLGRLGIPEDGKQFLYIFENREGSMIQEDELSKRLEVITKFILDHHITENIIIISDDGLPNLSDPFAGVIGSLLEKGMDIKIEPNTSSLITATMVDPDCGNGYVFAGIAGYSNSISSCNFDRLKSVSKFLPIIFFTSIGDEDEIEYFQNDLINNFGDEARITVLFNIGLKGEMIVKGTVKDLTNFWHQHSLIADQTIFTLVLNNISE